MTKTKSVSKVQEILVKTNYRYRNNYNANNTPVRGEFPGVKRLSKTIPNQSMTVREMIIRFASGLPISGSKRPDIFSDDAEDMPNIDRMDHVERENYYRELQEKRDAAEKRVRDANLKAEEMRREKVIKERVEKAKAESEAREFAEWKKNKGGTNEPQA